MAAQIVCPRCGARDSFIRGYLPDTCVCRVCQSQLDWREIPGCGPDCTGAAAPQGEVVAPQVSSAAAETLEESAPAEPDTTQEENDGSADA